MHKSNNHYFSLISSVWNYGSKWRHYIVTYYLLLGMAQAILSLSPYAFGKAIEKLQNIKEYGVSETILWLTFGIVITLLFWLFQGPGRILERNVALKIQQEFQLNSYKQLISLPLKWHQDHHSGNLIARINKSCMSLYHFAENQFEYLQNTIKFVMSIVFLSWISLPVGIASITLSLGIIIIVICFDKKLVILYKSENEIENNIWMTLFDYLNNITTILTLRLGHLTHNHVAQRINSIWVFFKKEVLLNEAKWFTSGILFASIQLIILITYIINILRDAQTIQLGTIVMIFRYQWELNDVFRDLSVNYSEIVRMNTDVQNIQPILEEIKDFNYYKNIKNCHKWNNIQITNMSFNIINETHKTQIGFNKLSLQFKKGEKIALIGLSGSGKSTLLKLLAGLYVPSTVQLKVDKKYFDSLDPLQSTITLIPQTPEIFKSTIKFNITLGLPVEEKQINYFSKISKFCEVVDSLPNGLETEINEKGLNLSEGQKQRLALTRGLLNTYASSIILMDEPTSSVDLPTEKNIITNIINQFPDKTIIISLHKLHLLPKFDSIIMLQQGEIISYGPVDALLQNKGPVYDLWATYNIDKQ